MSTPPAPADASPPHHERLAFTVLVASMLAPVITHGLARPLAHGFRSVESASQLTWASLAIGLGTGVARWWAGAGSTSSARRWLPVVVAVVLTGGLSAALALGPAGIGALLAAGLASAALFIGLPERLPASFDGLARQHVRLSVVYVVMAALSITWIARVSTYIGDPEVTSCQVLPGNDFVEFHSCLTAYVRASELVRQGVDNLYADHWWAGSLGLEALPGGGEGAFHPFGLDNFSYPPSFFLVAAVLAPLDGDFLAQRALWFGLNGLLTAFGLWIAARWVDGRGAHRVLLLAPLFFGSVPTLLTLQVGNFHLASTVLSVLAMVAFDRRASLTGAALLGTAILSKISPGILGIVLLVQRRLRDATLTAVFGALLLAVTVVWLGLEPLESFITFALPRLSSGDAFPFINTEHGIATNMAPFGIPAKLAFLGLNVGDPSHLGLYVGRAYTLAIVVLAVLAARRGGDRADRATRWLALLTLAGLQSPFSPAYVTLALLWATTLLAAGVRRVRDGVALVVLWPAVLLVPGGLSTASEALLTMAHTALTVGVSAWLIVRAPRFEGGLAQPALSRS
jgi:hypothetical protein